MKKLIVIAIIAVCSFTGAPNIIFTKLGVGSYGIGISKSDPLGVPERIHDRLMSSGFDGDLGKVGKPRTITYVGLNDSKSYPGAKGEIKITIGEEEYVQKIQGSYLNTQHQNSPQRNTPTGAFMESLWKAQFDNKPKFDRKLVSQMKTPFYNLAGSKIVGNTSAMIAEDKNSDISGQWIYSEDFPGESMILKLAD